MYFALLGSVGRPCYELHTQYDSAVCSNLQFLDKVGAPTIAFPLLVSPSTGPKVVFFLLVFVRVPQTGWLFFLPPWWAARMDVQLVANPGYLILPALLLFRRCGRHRYCRHILCIIPTFPGYSSHSGA